MTKKTLLGVEESITNLELCYNTLGPELQEMVCQKKIVGIFTPQIWHQNLVQLLEYAQLYKKVSQEVRRNVSKSRAFDIGCWLVSIVSVISIAMIFLFEVKIAWYYYVITFAVAGLIYLVYPQSPLTKKEKSLAKRFEPFEKKRSLFLPSFVSSTVIPVLLILKEEMKAAQQLKLTLNPNNTPFKEGNDTLEKGHSTRFGYRLTSTEFSRHEWWSFVAKLHEGSSIKYSFGHQSRKREFVKYKRKRNKYKSKFATKFKQDIRLEVPRSKYHYQAPSNKAKKLPYEFEENEQTYTFRITTTKALKDNFMFSTDKLPLDIENILNSIKTVYQSITPVGA